MQNQCFFLDRPTLPTGPPSLTDSANKCFVWKKDFRGICENN